MAQTAPRRHGEIRYVVRFLLVGVLNTCVGLGSIFACKYFFGIDDLPANVIGYSVGLTNSFFWNRKWTFSHSGDTVMTIIRFLLVFLAAYLANLAVVMALIRSGANAYLAHAVANVPYTAIFYLGSRYFAFVRSARP